MQRFLVMVGSFLGVPLIAAAQVIPTIVPQSCSGVDCTICDLVTLAQNLLNAGIYIAVFFSAIMFCYAGWQYATAAGGPVKQSAKETITNVAFGLIIILSAWLIVDTIMRTLMGSESYLPWNNLC